MQIVSKQLYSIKSCKYMNGLMDKTVEHLLIKSVTFKVTVLWHIVKQTIKNVKSRAGT